jgi:hypothetical protein
LDGGVSENPPPYGAPDPDPERGPEPQAQPSPYGQPYPQQPYYRVPDHQQATTVLVLGILGLVLCQVLSPVAWVMGNRVIQEIDASGGRIGGRGPANAGRICGIVGTILLGLGVLFLLLMAVFFIIAAASA